MARIQWTDRFHRRTEFTMSDGRDALEQWELEDDYLRQSCEPSYLTHPLWLAHQAKKPGSRDAGAELVAAREHAAPKPGANGTRAALEEFLAEEQRILKAHGEDSPEWRAHWERGPRI